MELHLQITKRKKTRGMQFYLTPFTGGLRVMDKESNLSDLTDEELMVQYIGGNTRAFEIVYRRHREKIRRYLERQSRNQATGSELAQEVWFKLVRACENGTYTAEAKFTTFLYRIAKNQLIDWYRKNGKVINLSIHEEDSEGASLADKETESSISPETITADKESLARVLKGIEELSDVQRATLLMQLEGNMSYDEIAQAMETTKETVKTRLRYARAHLKKLVFD